MQLLKLNGNWRPQSENLTHRFGLEFMEPGADAEASAEAAKTTETDERHESPPTRGAFRRSVDIGVSIHRGVGHDVGHGVDVGHDVSPGVGHGVDVDVVGDRRHGLDIDDDGGVGGTALVRFGGAPVDDGPIGLDLDAFGGLAETKEKQRDLKISLKSRSYTSNSGGQHRLLLVSYTYFRE